MDNYQNYSDGKWQQPPRRSRRSIWREIGLFLSLFAGFFILLSLVVMGPTIYTTLSYYFVYPEKEYSDKYELPVRTGSDSFGISDLDGFLKETTFAPEEDTVIIPKINVDAPIVYMDSYDNGEILESIKHGVGHYYGTALPGRVGNTFLTAHSSYYWWSGGEYNQVFANLDKLKEGDLIYVYHDQDKFVYEVQTSFVVWPSDTSVLEQTDEPVLTLMTCTPLGTNLKRLIVRAELVGRPPIDTTDFSSIGDLPQIPVILPLY